ncbi:hypothetical protein [Leptolyngbya sp. FACHB-8]|uniref:hypothetical protein n=1 Tax=unclassified Leptolyngbya TaxID=2650499 RepID=UPI0016835D11|nr:hypothetical protein [Leptolyngbya sp. FACHB-8]MBD2158635.1 hypothetical protein [Leptolyngbya sp. FACHB-16]
MFLGLAIAVRHELLTNQSTKAVQKPDLPVYEADFDGVLSGGEKEFYWEMG